jgi:hypothetical protein
MANRHNQFKKGGKVLNVVQKDKEILSEGVKKKATGGAVETKACGGKAAGRLDKRARGGKILDRKTNNPFSSAHSK